jgi:hypothetical protein
MEYLLGTLVFILLFLGYFVFNLLRKVEIYEDTITSYEETMVKQQEYLTKISEIVVESRDLIGKIDEKGVFESDDEVGEFFRYLKDIQEILNKFIISRTNG